MAASLSTSVILSNLSLYYGDDLTGLFETARLADELGIGQLVLTDHVVMSERTDRYPYGRFPYPLEEPWPEPLTTLAALAGCTKQVRLATGVLIAPLRPAVLLAKTLATLDALSGGRLDLGVGTGWQREEYEALGLPFAGRAERLDDVLRACRVLWRDAPASFDSPSVSFENVWCLPRPVQPGGIPIWFGVRLSEQNVARIAELGAGWMPMLDNEKDLWDGAARLREAFRSAGRNPGELGVRATALVMNEKGRPDLERSIADVPRLAEQGATVASFALAAFARSREQIRPVLEAIARVQSA